MKIDIWAHIFPEKYKNILYERTGLKFPMLEAVPPLFDLEARFRIMDKFDGLVPGVSTCRSSHRTSR